MEYFVIADVHSFYDEMMAALIEAGFNKEDPNHIIISCGDNFDRGMQSKQMLEFLYFMMTQKRIILVRGNHDDLFKTMINRGYICDHDFSNGTVQTWGDLLQGDIKIKYFDTDFTIHKNDYDHRLDEIHFNSLDYYETPHHIFVHGFIPTDQNVKTGEIIYDPEWQTGDWSAARWVNGMEYARKGLNQTGKTIVCGHWHCSYGHARKNFPDKPYHAQRLHEFDEFADFSTFYDNENKLIALDACTAFTKKCNVLHLTEDEL